MTEENGSPPDGGHLPVRVVTANQVVAWNLAWYRRVAHLTQTEAGELIGWSKSAVSDAERSWTGALTREFNAQELAMIASAFAIPIGALLLPPEDDGTAVTYLIEVPDGEGGTLHLTMTDLMALALPENGGKDGPMVAYRDRLREEVGRRFGEQAKAEADRWMAEPGRAELRADMAARHRARRDRFLAMAAEEDEMAGFYEAEDAS